MYLSGNHKLIFALYTKKLRQLIKFVIKYVVYFSLFDNPY